MLGEGRSYVELGLALTPSAPSALPGYATTARVCQVQLVPDGRIVEARVANLGQGAGRGIFAPVMTGDEVVVLFPGGDPNRAVVLGSLGNGKAPNPLVNDGLAMPLLHPGGVQMVTTDGQPLHGIVHGQFLLELATYLAALETFMNTVSGAANAGAIAAAANAFAVAVGPLPSAFATNVAASAASGTAPGVGGPPHATALHKVTP